MEMMGKMGLMDYQENQEQMYVLFFYVPLTLGKIVGKTLNENVFPRKRKAKRKKWCTSILPFREREEREERVLHRGFKQTEAFLCVWRKPKVLTGTGADGLVPHADKTAPVCCPPELWHSVLQDLDLSVRF